MNFSHIIYLILAFVCGVFMGYIFRRRINEVRRKKALGTIIVCDEDDEKTNVFLELDTMDSINSLKDGEIVSVRIRIIRV